MPDGASNKEDQAFDVVLARSGQRLHVPAGRSLLEVLIEAGVPMAFVCRDGICGTCETRIIAGEADHRDEVLTDAEKAAGETMMVCISRAKSGEITLDL